MTTMFSPSACGDEEDDPAVAALAAYRAALAPAWGAGGGGGTGFEFPFAVLDRLDVPLWTVALIGADGALSDGFGYGRNLAAAQASAWGEVAEWHGAREALKRMAPRRRGTFAALRRAGAPAVDPVSLCLSAGSRYSAEGTILEWAPVRRWPSGEAALVPAEFVAPRFADLGAGFDAGNALAVPITNGLGAGPSFAHALAHGVLELLQRDGNSVSYRALDRGVGIELDEVRDAGTRALLRSLDEQGVEVIVKLAATDFGLTNLYVVGYDRDPARALQAISLSACGEAVHPDREFALGKALREFTMARARKAFNHGPLGPVRAVAPAGYLEAFANPASMRSEDERALREMRGWMRLGHAEFLEMLRRPVFEVRERVRFSELPDAGPLGAEARLALLTERLGAEGVEILYADFTPPGSPVTVLKAIVPGLEVETMTYGRIGARNLRRLLARGSDLVGIGDEPRPRPPGAGRIWLTPGDAATFPTDGAGEPWLDPAAVGRAMGALYPLYREPGRHVIGVLEEAAGGRGGAG